MGYRTLAIQKHSADVWKILSAVKTEFNSFADKLNLVQKQLNTASSSLEELQTTRTNVMTKKLKQVEEIDTIKSLNILEIKE
jgi:DNA recombination protein RmuC